MVIKGLIALAFGTLALGVSEFVSMGLLPYIAQDFNMKISQSADFISYYAYGVSIGAFILLFLRKYELKYILIGLVSMHLIGTFLTSILTDFNLVLAARFLSGFPHGAYFGVGCIVATRLAQAGKGSSAIAIMVSGMTIANVFGVPLGTSLAYTSSWRTIFYINAAFCAIVLISIIIFIKKVGNVGGEKSFSSQFEFLKAPNAYLVLLSTLLVNGGIFTSLSFVSPILTDLGHLNPAHVSTVLVAIGFAMVIFNFISGRVCDRTSPAIGGIIFASLAAISMLLLSIFGSNLVLNIILLIIGCGSLFGMSAPQQVSMIRSSASGLLLGGSMIQSAFNIGNALGSKLGAIPLEYSWSIKFIPAIGCVLCIMGVIVIYFYKKYYEKI